jgi:CTP:molybdopterin cytidylyltransferase MocA
VTTGPTAEGASVRGLLLAAGAGRRMGRPKALVADHDGPWLVRGVDALLEGGCAGVTVVLGAAVDEALPLLDGLGVDVVVARAWAEGMGASLRAGLGALDEEVPAVLVHLVDLPDVGADVVARVLGTASGPTALARAAYAGEPGHPVLIGKDHWPGVVAGPVGDAGARDYLRGRDVVLVECGDLAGGRDIDSPDMLDAREEPEASG